MHYLRPKTVVGFCKLKGWRLSLKLIRCMGCLDRKKQRGKMKCSHFVRDATHPYWSDRGKAGN